uniref:Uncharacterized protein n=1 Tax=Anguilla anguilla TaxID=7936 RepID=A0A0E9WJA8_ANGAN
MSHKCTCKNVTTNSDTSACNQRNFCDSANAGFYN